MRPSQRPALLLVAFAALVALLPLRPAAAAGRLLDPEAVYHKLREQAHRYASRFAPPRVPKPPPWATRTDAPLATIAVLADPHYDDSRPRAWTATTRQRLLTTIRYLNTAVKPEAVLILGDIVANESSEQLRHVKRLLDAELRSPYYPLPGNHDGPGYPAVFGPRNVSFAIAGLRFIAIGIAYSHWDSGWGVYKRVGWLHRELAAHRCEPVVVLTHNPVALPTFENAALVRQQLDAAPHVLAVLSGHLHQDYELQLAKPHFGMPMLVRKPYAFKVLHLHADRILMVTYEEKEGAYAQAPIYQKIDIPAALGLGLSKANGRKAGLQRQD